MKNISIRLQQFVAESLHPNTLSGERFPLNDLEKWKQFISEETNDYYAQSSKLFFTNHKRRHEEIGNLINEVILLSNTVNGYLLKHFRLWKNLPNSSDVRQGYLFTCLAFENLVEKLCTRFPEIADRTRYTDFMLNSIKVDLKSQLASIKKNLGNQGADPELASVLYEGISDLINQRPLIRSHVSYLNKLMSDLMTKRFETTSALTDYLIVNDFNMPVFFLFCVNNWSDQISDLDGLLDQKQKLLDAKSHLFELTLSKGLKFPLNKERFYTELNSFLSEKYSLVKERLKISRQFVDAEGLRPRARRILINLSVAQLGLFIRLQIEKGILAKEHVGELFAFFAQHFYTPNTDFISADSLQKKSSDVEHATAVKLKGHLIAMLNWLNTHYNLSNFN